jgi:MoxR-like ATPase
MDSRQQITQLRGRIAGSIIGQEHVVPRLVIGLLANGNLLLEGLPGLASTRAVKSLAWGTAVDFSRIQFTPDLLPADITGTEVMHTESGAPRFRFEAGPIFANIVLADEINLAPAKLQAALLEAMEERQVTVAGTTHPMPDLFMVMATQNPVEQQAVFDARAEIAQVTVSEVVERYMVDLVFASRYPERYSDDLRRWIQVGASPPWCAGAGRVRTCACLAERP